MKTEKKKRTKVAPRQVWIILNDGKGMRGLIWYRTKRAASKDHLRGGDRVVGPFVLAERRREK